MAKPPRPEPIEVAIESVGAQGDGIGRIGASRVFVPFTLPGERILAAIVGERSDGLLGRALSWREPSPERVPPPCPQFGRCGGCRLQHWSDAAYAAWKVELLETTLRRQQIAVPIEPLCRTPPGGRRRAGLVAVFGKSEVRVGFRERASHRVIAVERCPVLRPDLERLAIRLPELLVGLAAPGQEWSLDAALTLTGIDLMITAPAEAAMDQRERVVAVAEALDLARVTWRVGERGGGERRVGERDGAEPIVVRRAPVLVLAGVRVEPPPGAFLQASSEGRRRSSAKSSP